MTPNIYSSMKRYEKKGNFKTADKWFLIPFSLNERLSIQGDHKPLHNCRCVFSNEGGYVLQMRRYLIVSPREWESMLIWIMGLKCHRCCRYSWGPTVVYVVGQSIDSYWMTDSSCWPAHQLIWLALKGAIVLIFNDSQCNVYSIALVFVRVLFIYFLPSFLHW